MSNNVTIALGADIKSRFLIAKGKNIYTGPSIGDLSDPRNFGEYKKEIIHCIKKIKEKPHIVACDLHPGYFSTNFAKENQYIFTRNYTLFQVQHHHAHSASVLAENRKLKRVIGVSFDGTGYGTDGNMWGGEFLLVEKKSFSRLAYFKYRMMPGGDKVVLEPWRMVVSVLGNKAEHFLKNIKKDDINLIMAMMQKNINSPLTSSAGRLFDTAAALLGICQYARYEAEGPIKLEAMCRNNIKESYKFSILKNSCYIIDTDGLFFGMADDIKRGIAKEVIAAKFHNSMIEIIVNMLRLLSKYTGIKDIVLSGGVFQNKYLMTNVRNALVDKGFRVYSNNETVNDLNIALGQYYVSCSAGKN